MYFARRELSGNDSHLLKDVVLSLALGEGLKLLFDVARVLPLQCRRPELLAAGTVAGRAGRDAALRIAGKYQALRGIGLPQAAARLRRPIAG